MINEIIIICNIYLISHSNVEVKCICTAHLIYLSKPGDKLNGEQIYIAVNDSIDRLNGDYRYYYYIRQFHKILKRTFGV